MIFLDLKLFDILNKGKKGSNKIPDIYHFFCHSEGGKTALVNLPVVRQP